MLSLALKTARKLVVLVIGGTVLLFGIALIVLPGPAFVVIPIGLAILAVEFAWAKFLLDQVKSRLTSAKNAVLGTHPASTPAAGVTGSTPSEPPRTPSVPPASEPDRAS